MFQELRENLRKVQDEIFNLKIKYALLEKDEYQIKEKIEKLENNIIKELEI